MNINIKQSQGGSYEKESKEKQNLPNGGFPPLVLCKNVKIEKKEPRSYKTNSDLVSINEILEKKKNTEPFFSI